MAVGETARGERKTALPSPEPTWAEDCLKWRGRLLTGHFAHWCFDWDDLPVDETTPFEFECCTCYPRELLATYEYQAGPFEPAVWPTDIEWARNAFGDDGDPDGMPPCTDLNSEGRE